MDPNLQHLHLCFSTSKFVFVIFFLQVCASQPSIGLSYISVVVFNFVYLIINIVAFLFKISLLLRFSHFISLAAAICVAIGFSLPDQASIGWLLFPYLSCYLCEAVLSIGYSIYLRCLEKKASLPPPYDATLPPYNEP